MAKPAPETPLDPVVLARFLVMPGIMPLLDAFGRIPPGPMRDSVIHLALTLADQYSSAPPQYAMPDPLLTAVGFATPAPLEKPAGAPSKSAHGPLPESAGPEADVIRRRKRGDIPQKIVNETGIPLYQVNKIVAEAKKAGMTFPNLKGKRVLGPTTGKRFVTRIEDLTGSGLAHAQIAADRRGIAIPEYLARKALAVEMAMRGEKYPAIMEATGEDMQTVGLYLSNARQAGMKVPYAGEREAEPEAPPESNVVQVKRWFVWPHPNTRSAAHITLAAARRNLTPEAYTDLKESIVRQRMAGKTPTEIAVASGETLIFVKGALQEATTKGAVFPKITKWGLAS